MKSAVIAFLACLLVLCAQGQLAGVSSKCKCVEYIGRINPKLIKTEPLIHHPNIFCPNTEIIITVENRKKCLNPQSPLGKFLLKRKNSHMKNEAVSMATPSTKTNTWSSTTE